MHRAAQRVRVGSPGAGHGCPWRSSSDPALWNRAVPVNGDDYTITVQATGYDDWSTTVSVANSRCHDPPTELTGDVNGDGRTDLIQPFNAGGRLGLIVYTSNGSGYAATFGSGDMGQGSGALAWLTGDVNGDGKTDILQPFDAGGRLGLIVYTSNGGGYAATFGSSDMGQGSGALTWLTGDVNGDHRTDLLQPWANPPRLGLITYTSNGGGLGVSFGTGDLGPLD